MNEIYNRALELQADFKNWEKTARAINSEFNLNYDGDIIRKRVKRYVRRHSDANTTDQVLEDTAETRAIATQTHSAVESLATEVSQLRALLLKKKDIPFERVVAAGGTAAVQALVDEGYNLQANADGIRLETTPKYDYTKHYEDWRGCTSVRFAIIGDTHFGSHFQQITHLRSFYMLCEQEGIDTVYHAGDVTEGVNMRPGHAYECFAHGVDEQSDYVIQNYPRFAGVTKFITGNHDHSGIKSAGIDIGRIIARDREDLIYLGKGNAQIHLTPNCTMELNHPLDGAAASLSHSIQKAIDALACGDKPDILINGHHHKAMYLFYRNVHAMESGTFEAQTAWMKGKRLSAYVGGWLCEAVVAADGSILRFKPEFIPYYIQNKNDY